MTGIILLWRDKKLLVAGVNLTQVISGLTVVKCYFANSFGRMSFEQKDCLNYGHKNTKIWCKFLKIHQPSP